MSSSAAFGLGLIFAALSGWAVLGQDRRETLCHNGHPAARSPYITYGGLPPMRGYQRDHYIPLCLGGPDVAAQNPMIPPGPSNPGNVWYEPEADATLKDRHEWSACEAYCAGRIKLEDARKEFPR